MKYLLFLLINSSLAHAITTIRPGHYQSKNCFVLVKKIHHITHLRFEHKKNFPQLAPGEFTPNRILGSNFIYNFKTNQAHHGPGHCQTKSAKNITFQNKTSHFTYRCGPLLSAYRTKLKIKIGPEQKLQSLLLYQRSSPNKKRIKCTKLRLIKR